MFGIGSAVFWVLVGLVIGWNVLPQPEWVKQLYFKLKERLNELFNS